MTRATAQEKAARRLRQVYARYGPVAGPEGPPRIARELFHDEPDPWQERVLQRWGAGERQISVRSVPGVGKTWLAAVCAWSNLLARFPQLTVATAPSKSQLEDALLKEIATLGKRLPPALLDLYEIKMYRVEFKPAPEESFFTAATARVENPEALQGKHSEHIALIVDEASGIPEQTFESALGAMTSEHAQTLLIGNPLRSQGFFFNTHTRLSEDWYTEKVSAADSPRVSDKFVDTVARLYGEESNAYRVRVLGEFPGADDDTVIPYQWVQEARERDIRERRNASRVWGLDIARFGSDRNALVCRTGRRLLWADYWSGMDLMATAGRVHRRYRDTEDTKKPRSICVDVIGLGAGVVDRLRELGLPVRAVNVAETKSVRDPDRYRRLRDELWFLAREWFQAKDVAVPPADRSKDSRTDAIEILLMELTVPRFTITSAGKHEVEPKSDMKKRGEKSPNLADAFVLTFAEPAHTMIYGSESNEKHYPWSEPIKRNVAVV